MLGGTTPEPSGSEHRPIRQIVRSLGKRIADGLGRWWDKGIWYRIALLAVIPLLAVCACCSGFTVFAFSPQGQSGSPNRMRQLTAQTARANATATRYAFLLILSLQQLLRRQHLTPGPEPHRYPHSHSYSDTDSNSTTDCHICSSMDYHQDVHWATASQIRAPLRSVTRSGRSCGPAIPSRMGVHTTSLQISWCRAINLAME